MFFIGCQAMDNFFKELRIFFGFCLCCRYACGFDFRPHPGAATRAHGSYVLEGAARLISLPATGSLINVAPAKTTIKKPGAAPVRILAMVR